MRMNLDAFAVRIPKALSEETCKSMVSELESDKVHWEEHTFFYNDDKTFNTRSTKELDTSYAVLEKHEEVMTHLWLSVKDYLEKLNYQWFTGWEGYTPPRYNRYQENAEMAPHCDHIHSIFDGDRQGVPILSILGCLNEDYEGGELIMWDDYKVGLKTGDFLVFPSNFLYPHRVSPVTSGTRYSLVSWAW